MKNSKRKIHGILWMVSSFFYYSVFAQEQKQVSQIPLIELYSSEGCSSCPPADQQMIALRSHKGLWTEFVPVNFHVDYWNRLGWTDRFSNQTYSQRQRAYSKEWGKSKVYTPAFIINGEDVGPQLHVKKTKSTSNINIIVKKEKQNLRLQVKGVSGKRYIANIAILANGLQSRVTSGENIDSLLKHEFVVVDWATTPLDNERELEHPIKKIDLGQKSLSYAVWITTSESQLPLQAVGGDL
jgi:hypothetical protein